MAITKELNERLTRVGPGTPMGEVFRRYWLPACLSEEIAECDGPPARVRLLGEDLIAFRDSAGEIGLIDAFCAHRRAPLFYGRNEECGLRCVYHGWKYDVHGACVDMPSEPPYSKFRLNVAITAYPTYEKGGVVFAYLGPTELMPEPPDYEWMRAPATHRGISKATEGCNYLQGIEGGVDSIHSMFLHNNDIANTSVRRVLPALQVEKTDYGFHYGVIRNLSEDETFVRVNVFIMPNQQMRPTLFDRNIAGKMAKHPNIDGHIWVPIDDEHTNVYSWKFAATDQPWMTPEEFDASEHRTGRGREDRIPGTYLMKRNASNNYGQDREVQRTKTFTGIPGVHIQDFAVQEGMGPIMERDRETLGTSDEAVLAARDLLIEALDEVEAGRMPRGSDPSTYRYIRGGEMVVPSGLSWQESTKQATQSFWE